MRSLILVAAALLASCATQSAPLAPVAPAGPPDKVEVVYHPDTMFFSVEDGGEGRFRTSDREDYTFPVSHGDYVRIRALLEPYREDGLICREENVTRQYNGYLLWRENGVETRRPHQSICYAEGHREAERDISRAYYAVEEMAGERWVPPPPPPNLPDPERITLTSLYWGRVTQTWTIPRGGEGVWSQADGSTRAFLVSAADFDRLRDLFRPYEGVRFECKRVIADGPYGHVTWSQQGHADQQLKWDAGCVTGDAADVFRRLDQAEALLKTLRDGA